MGFQGPFVLMGILGAAAVAVPVVLHFFFRSRYRTVPWAAMRFLLTSVEQTSRRLKLQEILLLLLRMTLLALLTLALTRLVAPSLYQVAATVLLYLLPVAGTGFVIALLVFFGDRWLNASRLLTFAVLCGVLLLLGAQFAVALFGVSLLPTFLSGDVFRAASWNEPVDAVFLIDNSMSMGVREGDETRLDRARAAARDVLDRLPPYSTVQVVVCADRAANLGPRVPANLDQARTIIDNIQLTHLATDLLPGAREAQKVIERRQLPNKELYVFSDMQKNGWERQSSALAETLRQVGKQATVHLVRCETRKKVDNVAITGITPEAGIPRPNERVGFAVMVKNTGKETMRDLQVALVLDGNTKERETHSIRSLAAGDTRAVTLSARMGDAGLHVITATVKSDDLEADNRFDQVILVREAVKVLVIDGALNREEPARSSSYFLLHALVPVAEGQKRQFHIQPLLLTPREAVPEALHKQDLCILTNVAVKPDPKQRHQHLSPEFLDELNRFVREGHGLIIFAGDQTRPADYNDVFFKHYRLLPFPVTGLIERPPDEPLHLNRNTAGLAVYQRFKEDKVYELFNQVRVWQSLALKDPSAPAARKGAGKDNARDLKAPENSSSPVTVAFRYDDGQPAVVANKVDGGEVLLFTTSSDPGWRPDATDVTWTNLPLLFNCWVPLVHETVNHLLPRQTQNYNAVAGRPLTWPAPRQEASKAFVLYQPDGKKRRLGLPTVQGDRPLLVLDDLNVAGVYRLVAVNPAPEEQDIVNDPVLVEEMRQGKAKLGRPLAVTPDTSESADLESMTDDQLDTLLGFPVVHTTPGVDAAGRTEVGRSQLEWTVWLLLAVLVVLAAEGLLAWFCGRPIGGTVTR
jgi:hypothetical protein